MLRRFALVLAIAATATPALAQDLSTGFVRAQADLLGLPALNDKIALGGAHLLCREAAIAATTPAIPGSPSRRAAQAAYAGVSDRLAASAGPADRLLIEGLRDAGMADASQATVDRLADQARRLLASRRFQVNPGTAGDMAVTCKHLAAGEFNTLSPRLAAR